MKKILVGVFLMGWCFLAFAQENQCEEILNQATEEFSAGHFYEIPAKLKPCIDKNDFSREQRVRAYLLLSQVYLIIDDPAAAEDSYLKLLGADPEYIATKEKDPIDVVYLSKKFTSTPVFTPHLRIGLNTSFVHELNNSAFAVDGKLAHSLRIGLQFGGGFDYNINNNWSLCIEGSIGTRGFKRTVSGIFENSQQTGSDQLIATERLSFLDVPLYLKYSDDKGLIRPYGYIGVAGNLLLGAKAELISINTTTSDDGVIASTTQGPDASLGYLRKTFTKSIVIGGGVKYKIGKDFVFADLRLMAGLNNMTTGDVFSPKDNGTGTFYNGLNDLVVKYGYVSPYYTINNVAITFGYIRPIYNPRKIVRHKNILRIFDRKSR